MEYVMVPVPEEIVPQVKDYIAWNLNAPKHSDNPDAVQKVVEEADPALRTLVRSAAEMIAREELPTLLGMSETAGMTPREVVGAVGDLFSRVVEAGRTSPLILLRDDPRELPEDRAKWLHKVLHMSDADAAVIIGSSLPNPESGRADGVSGPA